jgi:uridine phosphorylase
VTIGLRPTARTAADALLPGDPGRALALAQDLLVEPRMSNHHRGLWGYFGETRSPPGRPLTVQSTGIGGPSAAVVLRNLAELGVRRAVRLGTCVGRESRLSAGELVLCPGALALDGTSRALGSSRTVEADTALTASLRGAAGERARAEEVATVDLLQDRGRGAAAVEMAAAPLFALGRDLGVAVGCLLVVFEDAGGARLSDRELDEAVSAAGRIAAAALAAGGAQASPEPSRTSSRA